MATFRMRDGSGSLSLRFLCEDTDRHGNVRLYVRKRGKRKVRLHETPGTDAFMAEYRRALAEIEGLVAPKAAVRARQPAAKGSLRWLVQQYMASGEFRQLNPDTQRARRSVLEGLCQETDSKGLEHGEKPFARMEARHVLKLRDAKAALPGAANNRVKYLSYVFSWAMLPAVGLAQANPCRGVPKLRPRRPDGHLAWGTAQCAAFEARWPLGTQARLAYEIFRETDLRRSDACRLGPQHVRDGRIRMTLKKGAGIAPVEVNIPMSQRLLEAIESTPRAKGHLAFLVTYQGRPYSVAGLGNAMRAWCDQAGLQGYSAHGLRKFGATVMAEGGATELELMAFHGWTDPAQARVYTRKARAGKLADRAAASRRAAETEEQKSDECVPLCPGPAAGGTNRAKKPL